ncbi:hypothetical protein TRIUR3_03687 [Triticum urartu]|uniref:NmrA-like domain-containing protein n=1 Tax=Triticum urartu TaxID=4572 RepID=M7ZM33_TRIUA|nr:hypothetical protein TRIUR3_03687 [Triticum urartu]
MRIVMAVKEAGNVIKRLLPSEFGSDVERVHTVDPAATLYAGKVRLRRLIEAEEAAFPLNILLSLWLSVFMRGDQANFDIEPSFGVEATELYPDVKYTTVDDEYLDQSTVSSDSSLALWNAWQPLTQLQLAGVNSPGRRSLWPC